MKKITVSIGKFLAAEVVDLEKDFAKTFDAIGTWIKKEEVKLYPLIQAVLSEIQVLEKQGISDATTAAIAAAKVLLNDLIAAI